MEIRNNTPSFGMAFIKPKAEDMAEFTTYVTRGKKPKFIARGLSQLQKAHAKDKYVDIHYLPQAKGFSVIPKANTGVERSVIESVMGRTSQPFYSDTVNPNRLEKAVNEVTADIDKIDKPGISKLRKGWVALKGTLRVVKEGMRVFFSPKEILPPDLRAASAEATRVERGVDEFLAKEAAKAQRKEAVEKLINNSLK